METVLTRLSQYFKEKGISVRSVETQINASHGVLARALKNNTSISHHFLEQIAIVYTDLDLDWLLRGKGTVSVPQDSISPQNLQALVRKEVQEALKLQQM
jgi:transcriptional regulator with XRE-family HTH domain